MSCFLVGGSQRSGTSLLQSILCQDRTTNPLIREASYLRGLAALYRDAKSQIDGNMADYFDSLQDVCNFHSALVQAFLQRTAKRLDDCQNLVLKEPHLTLFFLDLAELLADAKFLVMVRDPRDTIASMVRVGQKQEKLGQQYIFASRDIPQLCQHYRSFYVPVLACKEERFRDRMLVLRYEDLVGRPAESVDLLRRFTGLSLDQFDSQMDPDTGRVDFQQVSNQPTYQPWLTELYGKRISKASLGKHKEVLTEEEIRRIETDCSDFMQTFNYSNS